MGHITLWSMFANASLVVQLVMLALLALSLVSWTLIFQRLLTLKRAKKDCEEFEERFWSGIELNKLYTEISGKSEQGRGLELVFQNGFKEFARLRSQAGTSAEAVMEGAQRAMRVALSRELEHLETHLSFLATVGSTTPYIGLFGTVWGIMNSFIALGQVKQATLTMVAPGIAEALIATAMGLFAAIPAVIAYNRFANSAERLQGQYDNFVEEFSGILHRKAHSAN